MFLVYFSVAVLVLIAFYSIVWIYKSFGEIQKFKMADPKWPPAGNQDVITPSYGVITSCGPQSKHIWTYLDAKMLLKVQSRDVALVALRQSFKPLSPPLPPPPPPSKTTIFGKHLM